MEFIKSENTTVVLSTLLIILFFNVMKPTRVQVDESSLVDPTVDTTLFIVRRSTSYISSPKEMKEVLIRYEGYRRCKYMDSKGIPTIGIGYNLQANIGTTKRLVGSDWPTCLSDVNIDRLYQFSVKRAQTELYSKLPWSATMPIGVRDVLIRMSFNMGMGNDKGGLLSFRNTLNYLKSRNFLAAANGFRASKWCQDVNKRRCFEEAKKIERG